MMQAVKSKLVAITYCAKVVRSQKAYKQLLQMEKTAEIAGSYVEFAERLPLPQYTKLPKEKLTNSHRREGFETGNADKIFESTFREQINKHS